MKKFFLIAALVLAVVSSIVAGTMAAYTQTLEVDSSAVTTKAFEITAEGQNKMFETAIKLAPGDEAVYKIVVTNKSEVAAKILVNGKLAAAKEKQANTRLTLTSVSGDATATNDGNNWTIAELAANATAEFTFTVEWPYADDAENNAADEAARKGDWASRLEIAVAGISVDEGNSTTVGQGA